MCLLQSVHLSPVPGSSELTAYCSGIASAALSPVRLRGWFLPFSIPHRLMVLCVQLSHTRWLLFPLSCRRSAGQTLPRRARAKARALTAAASMTRAAAIPRTSTRTTGAHHPASPALKTMRATRIPPLSSKCCRHNLKCSRHRAAPARLLLPRHRYLPSYQQRCQQPRALLRLRRRSRRQHPSPPASPRPPHRHLLILTSSKPPLCTRRDCHRLTHPCSL